MALSLRTRIVGVAGALLFAAVALLNGLDRVSADRPELAASVPGPFRANALRVEATEAVVANQPAKALPLAVEAMAASPGDVRTIAPWAQAQLLSGDIEAARRAYAITDTMGWREPSTQIFWMALTLERKDFATAADRLDAVLRQAPKFDQRDNLLRAFEGWPDGRTEIARRLVAKPAWRDAYFQDLEALPEITLYMRGEVAKELARLENGTGDCSLVSPLVWLMPKKLGYAEAYDVWNAYCRSGKATGGIVDGGFEDTRLTDPGTPFDWRFADRGDVDVRIGPAEGFSGQALTVSSLAPGRRAFARTITQLAPGTWDVRWRAIDAAGGPSDAIAVSLQCSEAEFAPVAASRVAGAPGGWTARVTLPQGCTTQWLQLAIAGNSDAVTIDDFSAAPAK
jgi:hypothetical protein